MIRGSYIQKNNVSEPEANIYADRSSLILEWLLLKGIVRESFSIREISRETGVSVGLAQRVIKLLVLRGFVRIRGLRTRKRFYLNKPADLMESWLAYYSIMQKCRIRTYQSALSNRTEMIAKLKEGSFNENIILALHSAAEALNCKNTNLKTLEIYLTDFSLRTQIIQTLQLEPVERGYDVLIIEPYYKSLLTSTSPHHLESTPPLLTYLDLYHYPLRGREQAEYMRHSIPNLRKIYEYESC